MIIDKKSYLSEKPKLNLIPCPKCNTIMEDAPEFGILESLPAQIQCVCPKCKNINYRFLGDDEYGFYCYGLNIR
jgi:Zn finger protein HypA/HybF involved in hydrogenase expression